MKKVLIAIVILAGGGFFAWSSRNALLSGFSKGGGGLTETPECQGASQARVKILYALWPRFNRGNLKAILTPKGECYKLGLADVDVVHFNLGNVAPIKRTDASIKITSIRPVQGKELPKTLDFGPGMTIESYAFQRGIDLQKEFYFIECQVVQPGRAREDRIDIDGFSISQNVDTEGMESLLQNGAVLVDLRPEAEFAKHHHASGTNIPFKWERFDDSDKKNFDPTVFSNKSLFDLTKLPQNKDKPLVFTGADVFDPAPGMAIIMAYREGWNNLHWYRAGDAGKDIAAYEVPLTWPQISVVDSSQALALKGQSAAFVDTRGPGLRYFPFLGRAIPGALRVPYSGQATPTEYQFLTKDSFQKANDSFALEKLPQDKSVKIVFVGEDQYDWAALKAAIWAKEAGYANVHWLREGIAGWAASAAAGPQEFPLQIAQ